MENNKPTGEDVAALLAGIHTHAELLLKFKHIKNSKKYIIYPNQVIYKEVDLIPVLEALGLPDPKWRARAKSVKDYKAEKVVSLNKVPAPTPEPVSFRRVFKDTPTYLVLMVLGFLVLSALILGGLVFWFRFLGILH